MQQPCCGESGRYYMPADGNQKTSSAVNFNTSTLKILYSTSKNMSTAAQTVQLDDTT